MCQSGRPLVKTDGLWQKCRRFQNQKVGGLKWSDSNFFYQKFRIFHLNDDRIETEIRKVKVSISVLAISFLKKKNFQSEI